MTLKNALFDLDGTLIDSMSLWRKNELDTIEYLYHIHFSEADRETLSVNSFVGAIRAASDQYGFEPDLAAIIEEAHRRMAISYRKADIRTKPYAAEFLTYIRAHGGKTAIATATPKALLMPCLERLHLLPLVDSIRTTVDDAHIGKTQSALVFEMALEDIGGSKNDTVIFEDAYHSIRTAKAAGFTVVGVPDSKQANNEESIRATADRFILNFKEMML